MSTVYVLLALAVTALLIWYLNGKSYELGSKKKPEVSVVAKPAPSAPSAPAVPAETTASRIRSGKASPCVSGSCASRTQSPAPSTKKAAPRRSW